MRTAANYSSLPVSNADEEATADVDHLLHTHVATTIDHNPVPHLLLQFQDSIGKTDTEIFKGGGVKESQNFKIKVSERELPAKREISFKTQFFGARAFLIYISNLFSPKMERLLE